MCMALGQHKAARHTELLDTIRLARLVLDYQTSSHSWLGDIRRADDVTAAVVLARQNTAHTELRILPLDLQKLSKALILLYLALFQKSFTLTHQTLFRGPFRIFLTNIREEAFLVLAGIIMEGYRRVWWWQLQNWWHRGSSETEWRYSWGGGLTRKCLQLQCSF